jgi:acetyl-CoA carboxylase carboxyl transferase subunit alpha
MTYLDFEKPIQDLEGELVKLREVNSKSKVKLDDKVKELEDEIVAKTKELYSSLTRLHTLILFLTKHLLSCMVIGL